MKLYTSLGPNPAVVDAFLLQRRATIETVMLDITKGESRGEPYISWNPAGTMPLLALDDGRYLAESIAICEYLDEIMPGETLIGITPEERALTRMWIRRIDLHFVQPASSGWRYAEGLEFCRDNMHVIPHAAADFKQIAAAGLSWIDGLMSEGDYVCGDRLTLADILLFVFVEFGDKQGQPVPPLLRRIAAWRARVGIMPMAAVSSQSV